MPTGIFRFETKRKHIGFTSSKEVEVFIVYLARVELLRYSKHSTTQYVARN